MTWSLTDRSLCQFHGITPEKEQEFYVSGIRNKDALVKYLSFHGSKSLLVRIAKNVDLFCVARKLGMTDIVVNMFPVGTRTRVISDRFEKTLFFDIETDGLGRSAHVTMISAIMNGRARVFVRGVDLFDFLELWNEAEIVVSFNGKRFDVPILMHEFGISRVPAHIDLLDESRHYGLKGGLKEIEKKIGFMRAESCCCNGLDAIQMWQDYVSNGDEGSLEVLKQYSLEDVKSLLALYSYLLPLSTEGIIGP